MSARRFASLTICLLLGVVTLQVANAANAAGTACSDESCSVKLPQFFTGSEGTHYLHQGGTGDALYRVRIGTSYFSYHEPLTLDNEDTHYWYYHETNFPHWKWTIAKCPTYACVRQGLCGRRSYSVCRGYCITLRVTVRTR